MPNKQVDVIIVGSGLAAFMTAKHLSEHMNVMIFTKSSLINNNSNLAQGGIAAAIQSSDHWGKHLEDTLKAGAFHNNVEAVKILTKEGPLAVQQLINNGMQFDKEKNGQYSYGMEGAHSKRRILHAGGDQTGKKLMEYLNERVHVQWKENESVIQLLVKNNRCYGIQTIDVDGNRQKYISSFVVLATGGAGSLYSFTSNDETVTGTGISMAYQTGARIVDLEFVQFHPTMLSVNGKAKGLISEAVRGEGAYLIDETGRRIMKEIHPQEDLAPRDVVARTIFEQIQRGHRIFLDVHPIKDFKQRFPSITLLCEQHGVSIDKGLIPIVPGAHFFMGGIETNIEGETTIAHLYAVGEVACNGVHGANRLASNSLLECLVFSKKVAQSIFQKEDQLIPPMYTEEFEQPYFGELPVLPSKTEIQQQMMKYAGIVRTDTGLTTLKHWLLQFKAGWESPSTYTNVEDIEKAQMLQLCYLLTESALMRKESRGAHYRSDYPSTRSEWDGIKVTLQMKEKSLV